MHTQRFMTLSAVAISLGFCMTALATGDGDYNGDLRVDWADFIEFPACMTGPSGVLSGGCEAFDFNGDLDVDIHDFAAFQRVFGTLPPPENMVLVPAGEFEMGDSFGEGSSNERPVHDVYLDAYYIDACEITSQQYADALNWAWNQGGLIHVSDGIVYQYGGTTYPYCNTYSYDTTSRVHWDGSIFTVTADKEDHPMGMVSWYGAVAFCNWRSAMQDRTPCYDLADWTCDFDADGFRLPTEAEWEKAAAWDPELQYHFRFGEHSDGCGPNCLDGARANRWTSGDPYETGLYPWTTPVGFYNGALHYKVNFNWPGSASSYQTQDAQSYYGCRDMSGNALEWCHDWWDEDYYSISPYDNPAGPASGAYRVMRSSAWSDYSPSAHRSSNRHAISPNLRYEPVGLRCVTRTP